jgi:hypothetical protein
LLARAYVLKIIADSKSLMVVSIQSKNEGRGEAQEALAKATRAYMEKRL